MAPWVEDPRENRLGKPRLGVPALGPGQTRDSPFILSPNTGLEDLSTRSSPEFRFRELPEAFEEMSAEGFSQSGVDPSLSQAASVSLPIREGGEKLLEIEETIADDALMIGLSVAGVALILMLIVIIYCCWRR